MAVDMFLSLLPYGGAQPIKGEAQDANHKGEIEVLFWSWAASQSVTIGGGPSGVSSGKITFEKFHLRKYVDSATPILYRYMCSGTPFELANLTVRKAGGNPLEYLTVRFKLVAVSNIQWSGPDETTELMIENVTFEFGGAFIKYVAQAADGKKLAALEHGYDIIQQKAVHI